MFVPVALEGAIVQPVFVPVALEGVTGLLVAGEVKVEDDFGFAAVPVEVAVLVSAEYLG